LLLHPYRFIGFTKASISRPAAAVALPMRPPTAIVRAEAAVMPAEKAADKALADGNFIRSVILARGSTRIGGRQDGHHHSRAAEGQAIFCGRAGTLWTFRRRNRITPRRTQPARPSAIDEAGAIARFMVVSCSKPARSYRIGSRPTLVIFERPPHGRIGESDPGLKNREPVPPSLHWTTPNPHIDFAG